jgi:hypothetical protein
MSHDPHALKSSLAGPNLLIRATEPIYRGPFARRFISDVCCSSVIDSKKQSQQSLRNFIIAQERKTYSWEGGGGT